jgi:hypothetical protein
MRARWIDQKEELLGYVLPKGDPAQKAAERHFLEEWFDEQYAVAEHDIQALWVELAQQMNLEGKPTPKHVLLREFNKHME